MTMAQQLKHARQMYILKYKSSCTLGKIYYGAECLRLRAKLEAEYQRGRGSILSRTCEGCKWDYTIANRDEDGNVIDDMFPSSCYICSRNMPDKWEQK